MFCVNMFVKSRAQSSTTTTSSHAMTLVLVLIALAACFNVVSSAPFRSSNDEYAASLAEGSSCSYNSKPGICVQINECPSIQKAAKHRKHGLYERCGFTGYVEVVCCTDESVIKRKGPGTSTEVIWGGDSDNKPVHRPRPTKLPVRGPGGERQSKIECEKYEKTVPGPSETITTFIIGGEDATEEEFPHMVGLGYENQDEAGKIDFNCGGSLISKRWILTAAHCMLRQENLPIVVRMGVINITANVAESTDYPIESMIRHPEYNRKQKFNDIALIKVKRDVQYNSKVHPACLFQQRQEPIGVIATGWGIDDVRKRTTAVILQKARLRTVPVATCNSSYVGSGKAALGPDQFCASSPDGNVVDTCNGDSGGPLQHLHNTTSTILLYSIVGITSYGSGCGGMPGVYTRVSSYLDWIERTVWP